MKKRNLAAACGMLLALAAGAGVTFGYLSAQETVVNTFTVGNLEIGLNESEWEPEKGDGQTIYPGYSVYKNPTVKNITPQRDGQKPCYMRMRIDICDANGELIEDADRLELLKTTIRYDAQYSGSYEQKGQGKSIVEGRIPGYSLAELQKLPMINPLFREDGERSTPNQIVCDYMGMENDGLLAIGDEAVLFTDIAIPVEWTAAQTEKAGAFQIVVSAEAIQSGGFTGQQEAFAALDAAGGGGNGV